MLTSKTVPGHLGRGWALAAAMMACAVTAAFAQQPATQAATQAKTQATTQAATPAAAPAAASAPAATKPAAPAATAGAAPAPAASAPPAPPVPTPGAAPAGLDQRVQDIKAEVIRLNRDLLVLEEELLFPAGTQVALFISMDVGKLFELESVQIKLDDKVVAAHLYTPLEVQALHRGGVQRIFVGNLRAGEHAIDAFFTGRGPHTRDYKRGVTMKFDKGTEPKYIELRIKDSLQKLQPEFEVKVWQ
jgi:hypothetical protein